MPSRAEMDDLYSNGGHIEDAADYPPRWERQAEAFRQSLGERCTTAIPYGAGEREAFDLFRPEGEAKGLVVFVHGGYWLRFDRSYWSWLAAGPLARGWAVAMPSYDLCPTVRISDITRQVAAAITRMAAEIDGPIRLTGHSAGGHLVLRMADVALLDDAVGRRIERIVAISPVADLRPLMDTTMNDTLQLDGAEAEAESPVLMTERRPISVGVEVGSLERPPFLADARALATAWTADLSIPEGRHHFDVIAPLAEPESALTRSLLEG